MSRISLRDALTIAAGNPSPPSTVDIDAAVATGHRRRVRKLSAIAVTVTCVLVATVTVGSAAVLAGPPTGTDPATTTQPPPTSRFPAPPTTYDGCVDLEPGWVAMARTTLAAPAGAWSPPFRGEQPPLQCPGHTARGLTMYVADKAAFGTLSVTFVEFQGHSFADCDPNQSGRCEVLPEGNLRLDSRAVPGLNKTPLDRAYSYSEAMLDTPSGYFKIMASSCVHDDRSLPPCLDAPPYTDQQLGELAVALARIG